MDKKQLKATLDQLHAELSAVEEVDPNTLAKLKTLTGNIDGLVEGSGQPAESESEDDSPVQHLRDMLLQFEAEHPQLSELLGRIADGLARMGI